MDETAPYILYINRFYNLNYTSAGIRASRFVQAMRSAGFSVQILTEGDRPVLQEIEEGVVLGGVDHEGLIPREVQEKEHVTWPWWELLPGPDPAETFSRSVYRFCHRLISKKRPEMIFVSGPPFALFVVALKLGRDFDLPVIVEMRDAWFKGVLWPYQNRIRRELARHYESECLHGAEKIVVVTETHKTLLLRDYPEIDPDKIVYIPHSYDPTLTAADCRDELPSELTNPEADNYFTLAYVGQVHGADLIDTEEHAVSFRKLHQGFRRILLGANFCEKLRFDWMSPLYLLQAIRRAGEHNPDLLNHLRLFFVGARTPDIDLWAVELEIDDNVRQMGTMPPEQAQQFIERADVLITSLYGIDGENYHWCVPNKTYSYIGTGKPVLALFPPGEARDIVKRSGLGFVVSPDDIDGIADQLLSLFNRFFTDGIKVQPDWAYIRQFEYSRQQVRFIELIRSVIPIPRERIISRQ